METVLRDMRYGVRSLLKRPGFATIAVITLALGIGANTAIFSVVNAVLLRPLPYAEAERLFVPWGSRGNTQNHTNVSYPDFADWQAQTKTLEHVAAYNSSGTLLREGGAEPELIVGAVVSADLFPLLKIAPILGRPFTRADDQPNASPVIVEDDVLVGGNCGVYEGTIVRTRAVLGADQSANWHIEIEATGSTSAVGAACAPQRRLLCGWSRSSFLWPGARASSARAWQSNTHKRSGLFFQFPLRRHRSSIHQLQIQCLKRGRRTSPRMRAKRPSGGTCGQSARICG